MTAIAILGAAAVQDDAVHAAHRLGWTVHVLAGQPDGPAARSADVFAQIDFSDRDAVERYVRYHRLDAVYSTGSDFAIPVSADVSGRLGLPRFVTEAVADVCNRKPEMRRVLGDLRGNVESLEIRDGEELVWTGRWPVIVKPADAQGQRGVQLVQGPQAAKEAIAGALTHSRSGTAIVEEFIDGPEVSVNGYLVDGRMVFLAVTDRQTWPEFVGLIASHVAPGEAADDDAREAVLRLMEAAAARLGISDGPLYAQVMLREGIPYIIEITPRLDGCHMWKVLRRATGVDLMDWTLRHLVKGTPPAPATPLLNPPMVPTRLDFLCQPPHLRFHPGEHPSRADSLERYVYYRDGDMVRPVNGRFEKVGFDIRPAGGPLQ